MSSATLEPPQQSSHAPASTSGGWLIVLQKTMQSLGYDITPLLLAEGVSLQAYLDPDYRIDAAQLNRLLQKASDISGDPALAIRIAQFAHPSTFAMLGYENLVGGNLLQVLQRLSRFVDVVSSSSHLLLEEQADLVWLKLKPQSRNSENQALSWLTMYTYTACVLRFLRELSYPHLAPVRAGFASATPEFATAVTEFFACDVVFEQQEFFMAFDHATLMQPAMLYMDSGSSDRYNQSLMYTDLELRDKLQITLQQALTYGEPSLANSALMLRSNPTELQHQLEANNLCFEEELRLARQQMAQEYLQRHELSIAEISYMLGFTSMHEFEHIFQQWFDCTPAQYRKQPLGLV